MKKAYHLITCNTCQRILKEVKAEEENFEIQELKSNPINEEELMYLYSKTGSFEALFNKRAMKYRSMGLNEMALSEDDFKKHILSEYTFLKRPIFIVNEDAFVGNSKKVVEGLKKKLGQL